LALFLKLVVNYAHILNLVAQAGLELVGEFVQKLRDGIEYIKASSNRKLEFYDAAETMYQLNVTQKLKVDISDHWNSTYKMVKNGLYFKDALLWLAERDCIFKSNFWLYFKNHCHLRFGPPVRSNCLGELTRLRMTGTVAEYQEKFLTLLGHVDPFPWLNTCPSSPVD
jgi:hypothetical protein